MSVLSNIQLSLSSSIQSLSDANFRHYLSDRYQQIIQNYRQEMIKIIVDTMEHRLHEFQKLFEDELAVMWLLQRSLSVHARLNEVMLDSIEKHLVLIGEKIQCIYEYKNTMRAL